MGRGAFLSSRAVLDCAQHANAFPGHSRPPFLACSHYCLHSTSESCHVNGYLGRLGLKRLQPNQGENSAPVQLCGSTRFERVQTCACAGRGSEHNAGFYTLPIHRRRRSRVRAAADHARIRRVHGARSGLNARTCSCLRQAGDVQMSFVSVCVSTAVTHIFMHAHAHAPDSWTGI